MTVDNLQSQAVQASADTAFENLFQEHWPRVYGIIFRIVGDPDETEDLALEAFLKLHSRMEASTGQAAGWQTRQGRGTVSAWLYRVATNLGLNALRSRKRRKQYEIEAGQIEWQKAHSENPAEWVERAEEHQRVRLTLSQIKPRSAKILILRHSGFSYAEIASVIRVSPNSVGKLLSRAEKEFERRYLAQEGRK